jgi:hypothetical protein
MKRWTSSIPRLTGVTLASVYSLYYASTSTEWHFIDNADLIFHEAGHVIFMVFGNFISVCMGSGFQVLLPLLLSLYFFFHRQRISGSLCLMWVGINLINVSIYAGDSIALQLPLLGGDSVTHDWNHILTTLDILQYTPQVAATLYGLGILAIGLGIALAYRFSLEQS